MLTVSNNETAELLTRELGFVQAGTGNHRGRHAGRPIALAHLGVPVAGVDLHDGSGLAPDDRVTCAALLRVVELGARPPLTAIDHGLPVAGRSGTLAGSLHRDVARRPAARQDRSHQRRGRAGGRVDRTPATGGAAQPSAGARFAFLANGDFSTSGGESLQDRIAVSIAAYVDEPVPPTRSCPLTAADHFGSTR